MRMLIAAAALLLTASAASAEDAKVAPAPETTTVTSTEQAGEAALSAPEAATQEQDVVKSRGYEGCHGRKSVERLIM